MSSFEASFVIKFSTRGRPRPSLRESWNDSDRLHDLSPSNSNEESCSFSGDDRNFNGHSHISAGDAANGTSLHAFNGLPTYLPTYLRTYISLILIAPRPASIASICITRTYIYTRIYTYRSLRFVALSRSDMCPFASIRPFPRSAGCTSPGMLSLTNTRKDGKCTLLFSPPPTVQAFGNVRLLRSSRSYFRLSSLSLSINFSSFFPYLFSFSKVFFSFLPSQSDSALTTLLAD